MKTSQKQAMQLLEEANAVGPTDLKGWVRSPEGRAIHARIEQQDRRRKEDAPSKLPPRRRRRTLLAATAGGLVITVLLAWGLLPGETSDAPATAAEVLRVAARVAEKQPYKPATSGQFMYTKSRNAYLWGMSNYAALVPAVREIWRSPDGSGLLRQELGAPIFLGERDRQRWIADGSPRIGDTKEVVPIGGSDAYVLDLTYEEFVSLPTDSDELERWMRSRLESDNPDDYEMFVMVGDMLRESVAPPDLRAALFRVAAAIPGVQLIGEGEDPVGRAGVVVAIDQTSATPGQEPGLRRELVFDLHSSALLGERERVTSSNNWVDAEPGTVIGWAAYLDWGVVDSKKERP